MTEKYFNYTDVLNFGWRAMKQNLWFFVALGFIWLIISYIPTIINLALPHLNLPELTYHTLHTIITILGWVITIILGIGIKKIALTFCDGRKPTIGTLFDAWDCFWRYLGTTILYLLIMGAGFILLFIPGIIWAVKFSLAYYFVIEKALGPIEALKASSRTTMGVKWELFGFGILCILINLLGILCLIVGIFAAYPTVIVANALVYRQLLAQTPQLREFGIQTPALEPESPPVPPEN